MFETKRASRPWHDMNFKTTLLLLIVLLAVGGYVIYDRVSGGADKDKVESAADSKKLFDVKNKDDVNSVTIKSADGSEIVLAKTDNKWRMTKPVESAAEAWQVDSLVRDLIDLESRGQVAPSSETGLDKPKFNVELSAKGGKLIKFAVGNKTPLGDLFVRVEGHKQADVVSADVYERLGKPANELRDKQLVTVASNDIKQLTIDKDGQKLVLQKKGSAWELMEPKKLPADDSTMTDLLGAVTGLRASDWVAKDSPDVAKAMFDKPQMTVAFTIAAPATQPATTTTAPAASQPNWTTVAFGQYEDIRHQKVYARISDSQAVVKVAATPIDTLTKKPFELRDKKVLDIIPEQVSRIAILTDLPAGPAPTTKPAKKSQVNIERRKQIAAATTAPATKPVATTQPSTRAVATTQPTTGPATTQAVAKAEPPPSTWELKFDPKGEADDDAVRNLLTDLHPLRVTKYFESTPTTKPTGNYVIDITTEGPGGTPVTAYQLKLADPGGDLPLHGEYNGLSFELPRTFLTKIEGNFAKKPKAENKTPAGNPADFNLPGDNK